ncbi:hypothetical protein, partial [Mycobacterium tuberculosis]
GWAETFGQDSRPATTRDWPERSEVRSQLQLQLKRVLELLGEHRETIIARAAEVVPENGWPLLPGIIHGWHDEARHQGEIHLLQKL